MPIISPDKAVSSLKNGRPVALPTETVYGLAAPIDNEAALQEIFRLKKRPSFDPLIVHVHSLAQAEALATWDPVSRFLAKTFWPGPLTVVLERAPEAISSTITAGGDTVGLRSPHHSLFRQILVNVNTPLAAPSANRFGKTSPTSAEHVLQEFPMGVEVVDGGPCQRGIESTVVQVSLGSGAEPPRLKILRPGAIHSLQLEAALASGSFAETEVLPAVQQNTPGFLKNHYQPDTPLVLLHDNVSWDSRDLEDLRSQLCPSAPADCAPEPPVSADPNQTPDTVDRSPWGLLDLPTSPELAARNLYRQLRELNLLSHVRAIVCPIHQDWRTAPHWQAILDRLQKASHFQVEKNLQSGINVLSKSEEQV